MSHVLDNPIWHGLNTGNKDLSLGSDKVGFLDLEIGLFAGLKKNDAQTLNCLCNVWSKGRTGTFFLDKDIALTDSWEILEARPLFQMVYEGERFAANALPDIIQLSVADVPAMMALAKLAKPGAFFQSTIEFGNYKGIFEDEQLIAMGGFRFKPLPYIEISAICTHPAYLEKGHSSAIIKNLVNDILDDSKIPFLHVAVANYKALKLYEKLGFRIRRTINLLKLRKS